jgi:hypothetical protein
MIRTAWPKVLPLGTSRPVVVEVSTGRLTSDAGLLPIRGFDRRIGLTERFAAALRDPRRSASVEHSFPEMLRSRLFGVPAGYEDQNDHDVLRRDPVFKLVAGRDPDGADLASQPTLSRFENAIDVASLNRLRDVLIDQFVESFDTPPARLTLDVDPFDDPAHGHQQLVMFHGFYDLHQYLARVITCAENDAVVMACLLFGSANAALGADDDLEYLVGRLRAAWPDVALHVRGDSGFGLPGMYAVCERLRVSYSFGLGMNPVLQRESAELLEFAVAEFERTGTPQRLFHADWYRAGSWPHPRWTIVKVEANAQGTNRRVVVTNRPGAAVLPAAAYDEYADRGESENRNKELKCGLSADRLSDHRYLANLFRLYLHAAAHNLLVRLRRLVALPPEAPPSSVLRSPTDASLPLEALAEPDRRAYFNHRRRRDVLGEGHPATWRTRLIKVAAEVVVSTRRVLVRLASNWPYLPHYAAVTDAAVTDAVLTADTG